MLSSLRLMPVLLLVPAALAQPQPAQILRQIPQAYARLQAVDIEATRHGTVRAGMAVLHIDLDLRLALNVGSAYHAEWRNGTAEGVAVSDGSTTWKALPKTRQWSRQEVVAVGDDEEEETAPAAPADLHHQVARLLILRYSMIARRAVLTVLVKEENFSLKEGKRRCYVIRTQVGATTYDLWVDKESSLVLREVEKGPQQTSYGPGQAEIETRVKHLAVNGEVDAALFTFTPESDWSQVRALMLPGEERPSLVGRSAADFTLKSLNGEQLRLSSLRGQVVVLDFWATWCPPCRAELPAMVKLKTEFGDQVRFLGVNDEAEATVKGFLAKKGYELDVLHEDRREVSRRYGVRAIPTVLIIDRDGVIRQHYVGTRQERELRAAIQSVISMR
jgi:peroxiredoxin/outer membrane lipoprotein-sorting protein